MKLSDIRGRKSLYIVADIMDLVESLKDDNRLHEFVQTVRESDRDSQYMALCKLSPILRDSDVQDRLISIMARAKGVDEGEFAESGDILGEIWELVTTDMKALDFFDSSGAIQPPAGSLSASTEAPNLP